MPYLSIKVYLHQAKANAKVKFFFDLSRVNIKLDSLWTHLEASAYISANAKKAFPKNIAQMRWEFVQGQARPGLEIFLFLVAR